MTTLTKRPRVYTVTECMVCAGELIRIEADGEEFWVHSDLPLAETAGHNAQPDPAQAKIIEE